MGFKAKESICKYFKKYELVYTDVKSKFFPKYRDVDTWKIEETDCGVTKING